MKSAVIITQQKERHSKSHSISTNELTPPTSSINDRIHFFSETNTPISFKTLPVPSSQRMQKKAKKKPFSALNKRGEMRAMERRLRVSELVLRLAVLGLAVAASALVGSASQVRRIFSLEKRAMFTDMKVLVFLVVANGVAAGYNLLQVVRCLVGMMKGRSAVFGKGFALVIFACDQVMAYVTLSAVAGSVQSAALGQFGQSELQWMKICNLYRNFCTQIGEGLGSAFIASLAMIIISCISAFNLFRLYGINKGCKNSNGSF